jgi:hypothetical protein
MLKEKDTPLIIIKRAMTIRLTERFIKAENDPATTTTYLGKDNFRRRSPLPTIADNPLLVTSIK